MAQKYGITPWGKWFIDVLDSYRMGARLERGKTYANTGKVTKLEIEGRTIKARVKGRSSPYYTVVIGFPALSKGDVQTIVKLASDDTAVLANIATGTLPEAFLNTLKKNSIELIPTKWNAMKRSCSCPDWGDPCKHMAAVYYILAREVDTDPKILFTLRGIDLEKKFGESLARDIPVPFDISFQGEDENKNDKANESLAKKSLSFEPPNFGNCLNFIQSLLPTTQSFSTRNFSVTLMSYYHSAYRVLQKESAESLAAEWEIERSFARARWTAEIITPEKKKRGESPILHNSRVRLVMTAPDAQEQIFTLTEAYNLFFLFSEEDGTESYRFLFKFFRYMHAIEKASAYIPCVYAYEEKLEILWQPLYALPAVRNASNDLAALCPSLFELALKKTSKNSGEKIVSRETSVTLLSCALLTECVRARKFSVSGGDASFRAYQQAFFSGTIIDIRNPTLRSLPLAISTWLSAFSIDHGAFRYRFTLKEKTKTRTAPDKAFTLSASVLIHEEEVLLKDAAEKSGSIEVLKAPTVLSMYLPELTELMSKKMVALSHERLATFLGEASSLLSRLGAEVVLPKSLHKELAPRLTLRGDTKGKGASLVSYLSLPTLLEYDWAIAVGDTILDPEEFESLVHNKTGLVAFRDGYILLDPEQIALLLKRANQKKKPDTLEVIKQYVLGEANFSAEASALVQSLMEERDFPIPSGLQARLRPYQERGFRWMCSLLASGFGCILADDMGLGKTVQAIAAALALREQGYLNKSKKNSKGILVVAPSALLLNWEKELARFAPELSVESFHGVGRSLNNNVDVHITTWQTAVRDADALDAHGFSLLIADEAHLIKNAHTKISRTIKSFTIPYKIALSGTPVENRLEDLRSLFDFITPGYLGSEKAFKSEYRIPIEVERNEEVARRLNAITSPFLLRRLKTDKKIINDLPDKITITEHACLNKEQAALYESLVQKGLEESSKTEGTINRSALILSLLTNLKQVCNHPRVYDKQSPMTAELSGKCELLVSLLSEILRNKEKVLIFSQYVETLKLLETIILKETGEKPILYHGGMTAKARSAAVESFQTDDESRIMLISLKAGGLGLNLTAASRVIHFDLWYNPAVEQQATDRAFRIGQTKEVFVHRFVVQGTFEEKIDAMLTSRKELADMVVSSGETWLTRMSHEDLVDLFRGKRDIFD